MAPIDELDVARARDLATAIQEGIHNLETTFDVQSRDSVVNACQKLVAILKPTDVALSEIAFAPGNFAMIQAAMDAEIPQSILAGCGTVEEIATSNEKVHDTTLIQHVLQVLKATHLVDVEGDKVLPNRRTKSLAKKSMAAGFGLYQQTLFISYFFPDYLIQNGYRFPTDIHDGPFQFAHRTPLDAYAYWAQHKPEVERNFNAFMEGNLFGTPERVRWMDWFDVKKLLDGVKDQSLAYAFVDVGGGVGHECEALLKKHPDIKGRLILQERAEVLKQITKRNDRIEPAEHDFFQPQPVKGARIYFLQNILHNWADGESVEILKQLAGAMERSYSYILIANIIMPYEPSLRQVGLDNTMLYLHNGKQRNEAEWRSILSQAGLKATQICYPPEDGDGVILAELQEEETPVKNA